LANHRKGEAIVLLVRVNGHDVRQLLLIDGHIRISRLIHLEKTDYSSQLDVLLQELILLEKFAKTQKMMKTSQRLHLYYVASDDNECQHVNVFFMNSSLKLQINKDHFVDSSILLDRAGDSSYLYERLLVMMLNHKQLTSDYHTPAVDLAYKVNNLRFGLWLISATVFLFLITLVINHVSYVHETDSASHKIVKLNSQYQDRVDNVTELMQSSWAKQYDFSAIKMNVEAIDVIHNIQHSRDLVLILSPISQVLIDFIDINLIQINVAFSAAESGSDVRLGKRYKAEVSLTCEIKVESGAILSEKMERINLLVNRMNNVAFDGSLWVQLQEAPFNVSSDQSLRFVLEDTHYGASSGVPFKLSIGFVYD
jgi:hypothetical protein